ncbi:MAG: hypothetical protein ABWY26_01150 [Microbacterium sp.]
MRDEPSHDPLDAEQGELDALRRRAYGPDADIFDDPVAVERLAALEDHVRLERVPRDSPSTLTESSPPPLGAGADAPAAAPASDHVTVVIRTGARAPRAARWHTGLVTSTAVIAALLGAAAWSAAQVPPVGEPPSGNAKSAAIASERRAAEYEASYDVYLDGLRDEVLTLPGIGAAADRMIRDQLKPYGILYGRTVGAGPTTDSRFCMIIADMPQASVTCISIENAYANPVSVVLPTWYADADRDRFTGLGDLVSYTLMPGGGVVAVPADTVDGSVPQADSG